MIKRGRGSALLYTSSPCVRPLSRPRAFANVTQADLDRVLFDVVLLQHGMRTGLSGVRGMSLLLPHLWADFIRHGDLADVAGLGTRPLARD